MNLELDGTERALQEGVRDLRRRRFDTDRVRTTDRAELWEDLDAAGVLSVVEDAGLTAATVVFEELGRSLVPGPLVATALRGGREVATAVDGDRAAGGHAVVEADADVLVVVRDDGVWEAPRPDGAPLVPPLDPLTPLVRVAIPDGDRVGGPGDAARWRLRSNTLRAALLLGIALETTELATAYAAGREQFGRPIGSFQAVKHLCADMLVRAEVARAAVYAAAVLQEERAVAGASLLAGDAAVRNGEDCIQVHGGMGFTWEVAAHLHLKRAVLLRAQARDDVGRVTAAL